METGTRYVGTVGKRAEFEVTRVFSASWATRYGEMYAHVFRDAEGRKLVYRSSSTTPLKIEKGGRALVKATVKAHSEYRGEPQTELSRLALLETYPTEAEEMEAA